MAKWNGKVGYVKTCENPIGSGIYEPVTSERSYRGELIRNNRKIQTTSTLNDDITISDEISIIADPFAYEHFFEIRYVTLYGVKWKVTNVSVQRPRLVLTVGGVYND